MTAPAFWPGRRVFVTGHTGFKGTWLTLWLLSLGAAVRGYSLDPGTSPAMFNVVRGGEGIDDVRADVRDVAQLNREMDEYRPDIAFHLAAQSLVRRSYDDPLSTFSTNVMGTANFLEAVRRVPSIRVAIVVTSDKCYANAGSGRRFVESDPMGGSDPYSASKGAAELVVHAYRIAYFSCACTAKVATARAGNVIGGGDWSQDRLIPDLVRASMNARAAIVRSPSAIRPWQHVLEPLSGYLRLAQVMWDRPDIASGWNFGPGVSDEISVGDVAARFVNEWGGDLDVIHEAKAPVFAEARVLRLNSECARATLDWKPRWNVEVALRETVHWYRRHAAGDDMRQVTLAQIRSYDSHGAMEAR